jgi:ATP phosphoribosyltransferase regulatory subunit
MNSTENKATQRSAKLSEITEKISNVLHLYAYSEVFLPLYEYYDDLKDTVYDFNDDNVVKFIDRSTGKSMVLRPDFTPQVCRTVANYSKEAPLPLRLSYKGRVFRNVNLNKGIKSEKYQMGAELFGAEDIFGDIESILLASKVMKALDIQDYKIVIGDIQLLNFVLEKTNNNEEYKNYLTGKEFSKLKETVEKFDISENLKVFLKQFPYAFGDIKVFDELLKNSDFDKTVTDRINYLKKLFLKLISLGIDENKLIFDAGETRGLDYYTGLNFDIIHIERGVVLGGGGRYDSLMNNFGFNMTACGVAFNIEEIMRFYISSMANNDFDYLIIGEENIDKAEQLRNEGKSVFWISSKEDKENIISYYKFKNI